MPSTANRYTEIPIGDLGLRLRIYKHLYELGVVVIGDLVKLPEETLEPYLPCLLEGIARVKRNHMPPER